MSGRGMRLGYGVVREVRTEEADFEQSVAEGDKELRLGSGILGFSQ